MSTFKALNIVSDDESDDEIDNTKEIQIEEALKIYQTALKLHASEQTLGEAGDAYEELFKSDIFKFPESQSEYNRVVAYEDFQDEEDEEVLTLQDEPLAGQAVTENAPNTLPQVLHLSYKNRGEHHLDLVKAHVQGNESDEGKEAETPKRAWKQSSDHVHEALQDFTEALDKDEDDKDLWRRSARVSQALKSQRTSRYCLESALQEDDEGTDSVLSLPNLEALHDRIELRKINESMEDDLNQSPNIVHDKGVLPSAVRVSLELYPFLPTAQWRRSKSSDTAREELPARVTLVVRERSLDAVGQAILDQLVKEQEESFATRSGAAISLLLPVSQTDSSELGKTRRLTTEGHEDVENIVPGIVAQDSNQNSVDGRRAIPIRDSPRAQRRESTTSPSLQKADLPSRKRSTDAANLAEAVDGERHKSKRLRTRKSTANDRNVTETPGGDLAPGQDGKHDSTLQADRWLFDLMRDIFRKMDVKMICNADQLRKVVSPNSPYGLGEGPSSAPLGQAMQDLYSAMQGWNSKKTSVFEQTNAALNPAVDTSNAGLLAFLDSSAARVQKVKPAPVATDVEEMVDWINATWTTADQAAVAWIRTVMSCVRPFESSGSDAIHANNYLTHTWSETMKSTVTQLLLVVEFLLYETLAHPSRAVIKADASLSNDADFVQGIFELQLDHLVRITGPTSDADAGTISLQRARLMDWCDLAREYLVAHVQSKRQAASLQSSTTDTKPDVSQNDSLVLRHLWATVFSMKALEGVSREHLLLCIDDLKHRLSKARPITIRNNNAIPEISVEAADREKSKWETMDFFLSIFQKQDQHPADLVEKLEPILMQHPRKAQRSRKRSEDGQEQPSDSTESAAPVERRGSGHEILAEFLAKAKPILRLSLWYRLRNAYESLDFNEKVFSIDLRIMRVIVGELQSSAFVEASAEERERLLLTWLHDLHKLLKRCYAFIEKQTAALGCLQIDQIREATSALIAIFTLLHTVALYDDFASSVQKGPPLTNPFRTYPSESFHPASIQLHDMKLRTIIILYRMIEEAAAQLPSRFLYPDIDRYEYLQYMHYELGIRRICKASDNLFLRFMQTELLLLRSQPMTNDLAQVLFDLYDLQCFSSAFEKHDHGCEPDYLDRDTALALVDFVLERTHGTNLKDLLKVDLGKSVEKMQNALGAVRSTTATIRNRKIIGSYLKAAINPIDFFQCFKGMPLLSTLPIPSKELPVASKGWYFLMAQINLAKHRRSKGQPTTTDDLDIAISFLVHDLEFESEKWESWHRLAYANDCLVEESVLWSAEKVNTGQVELAQMQRASLHAYVQAVATAIRSAEPSEELSTKLVDIYAEFAARVYSSSRPPFSMEAFSLKEFPERYYSGPAVGGGTYSRKPFKSLRTFQANRLAAALLRKAIRWKPRDWHLHYLLGKCLWKMHVYKTEKYDLPHLDLAFVSLSAFNRSIEVLPPRKDPARQEPTLEPVSKIVFTLHKMVARHELAPIDAAERITTLLFRQNQFEVTKPPSLEALGSWEDFMLAVLRVLRTADRAKWHHRLHFKMAELIYLKHKETPEAARLTRDFMADEKLYSSKTLALTVWKPDLERAGRHWVYMTNYTRFVSGIFEQAEDIEAMQLLARRVRKKPNEFFDHGQLWDDVAEAHLRLFRKHGSIPLHNDDAIFKNLTQEEFKPRAEAVDAWLQKPETSHLLLDILREVTELKKLNAGLAKPVMFDDLIADTYAQIYKEIGSTLPLLPTANGEGSTQPGNSNATATPEPQLPPVRSPERSNVMALNNLINMDGANDAMPSPWRYTTLASQSAALVEPALKPRAPRAPTRVHIIKRATESAVPKVTAVQPASAAGAGKEGGNDAPMVRVVIDNRRKSEINGGTAVDAGAEPNDMQGPSNDASSELSEVDVDEMDAALPSSPPSFHNEDVKQENIERVVESPTRIEDGKLDDDGQRRLHTEAGQVMDIDS